MTARSAGSVPFSEWIARPQSLIALAAVLLSLCGLFIAIYEASLMRRQQRASVWPHLEVSATVTHALIEVRVQNTGVGPARVRTAGLTRDGGTLEDWADLARSAGLEPQGLNAYQSLIRGSVLPRDSEPEVIFRLGSDYGGIAAPLVELLHDEVLRGRTDVVLCYCSVFDECWTSSLADVFTASQDEAEPVSGRKVESCDAMPRSRI